MAVARIWNGTAWVQVSGGGGVTALPDLSDVVDGIVPSRGSILYGNATPLWDELTVGAADYVLGSDGTDVAWVALAAGGTVLFVTGVSGSGSISNITYFDSGASSPANAAITAFESNNDGVALTFTLFAGGSAWQPLTVTASGAGATPVASNNEDWTQVSSVRVFTDTITLTDADTTGTITLTTSDSATYTVAYTRGADPPAGGANTIPVNWVEEP